MLALDQIDTLLAQSLARTDDPSHDSGDDVLHQVADGLMAVRQKMRRTVAVVACLPAVWEGIRDRATATVADRFRVTAPLKPLPTPDIGRAILERRFVASYAETGFQPPYPSWPILPAAFTEAPDYTPRQLLIRADAHVRQCLKHNEVVELDHLHADAQPIWESDGRGRRTRLLRDRPALCGVSPSSSSGRRPRSRRRGHHDAGAAGRGADGVDR